MFRTLLVIALSSVFTLGYAADDPSVTEGDVMAAPVVKKAAKKVKAAKPVKAKAGASADAKPKLPAFQLSSTDIAHASTIDPRFEYDGFGCAGENTSPELHWSGAPKETKSYAVTVYDPDAPTGSGWWHWIVYNIPADTTVLEAGAGALNGTDLPENTVQATSDYGVEAFGGMCPPPGDKPHHYVFTVHALNVEQLDLPDGATSAAVRYVINASTIAKASFTAEYSRPK